MIQITVYKGLDSNSTITWRLVKDLTITISKEYELDIKLDVIEVPTIEYEKLPKVAVNGEIIVEGRIPGIDELVNAIFDVIKEKTVLGPAGFPLPVPETATEI
ncbi:MAG: hypothetical protein GSR79_08405 [Desulfurococcales archaeon]|nr:hypothetical protein [Desulfurococcales archaeon]